MTPLYAELNRWRVLPHRWGVSDCITLPADWVHRMRGTDPAADLRLCYESFSECQRLTRFFTDPMGVIAPRMQAAGLPQTPRALKGDVGLILLQTDRHAALPHGALCLGESWAVKCVDGSIAAVSAPKIIAAWAVGYENS